MPVLISNEDSSDDSDQEENWETQSSSSSFYESSDGSNSSDDSINDFDESVTLYTYQPRFSKLKCKDQASGASAPSGASGASGSGLIGGAIVEVSGIEEPGAEEPRSEGLGTEGPGAEEPRSEGVGTERPGADGYEVNEERMDIDQPLQLKCNCNKCVQLKPSETTCCTDVPGFEELVELVATEGETVSTYDDDLNIITKVEKTNISCLTQLTSYRNLICNKESLSSHLHQRSHLLFASSNLAVPTNKEYRFAAYCLTASFLHGKCGRYNRKCLPSCMYKIIRALYPSEDGIYEGFKEAFICEYNEI